MKKEFPTQNRYGNRSTVSIVATTGFASRSAMTTTKCHFGQLSRSLLAAGAAIIGSQSANATYSYTFTPSAPDLNDLDHHSAYMWVLNGIDASQTYTSASLTITNINNWDLTKNILFIHLFDTGLTGQGHDIVGSGTNNVVTSYQDVDPNQVPVVDLSDAFGPSSLSLRACHALS